MDDLIAYNHNGVSHKPPGTLSPDIVTSADGKGKRKATALPLEVDESIAFTFAMGFESEEEDDDQEYYGAGVENILASEGIASSAALPPLDNDMIDHTGVGVYVDGVSAKPVVVEDSLWGDPLEERNKNKNKSKNKKEEELLCDYHGKVCSRGICKVYEKQLREQKKLKEAKESQNWRGGKGGPNNGRGERGNRGFTRGTRDMLLRGKGGPGGDFGPRSLRDGEICHTDFFLVSRLNHFLSQKTRPQGEPTASTPLKMRGPNPAETPAETPKATLLGGPTTTRGAQAR